MFPNFWVLMIFVSKVLSFFWGGGRCCFQAFADEFLFTWSAAIHKAAPRQKYRGSLDPGEWAYINMTIDELTDNGIVAVQFNSTTGHPILLAQLGRLPTLKDYQMKFTNSTLGATPSDTYHINVASLGSGHLILGVFNIDYAHRGVSEFNIVILGEYG